MVEHTPEQPGPVSATIAFIDLAGFSAITDVFGDLSAIAILEVFEALVAQHTGEGGRLVKWIGDEAMLVFSDPDTALASLGRLLPACRADERIPLTRSALHHGPVISRGSDIFGATVNAAARMTAIARPGDLIATAPVAEVASKLGIKTRSLGAVTLRSMREPVSLYKIELAGEIEPAWIDPVCKMHAPYAAYQNRKADGLWFCSPTCEAAYRQSPATYKRAD